MVSLLQIGNAKFILGSVGRGQVIVVSAEADHADLRVDSTTLDAQRPSSFGTRARASSEARPVPGNLFDLQVQRLDDRLQILAELAHHVGRFFSADRGRVEEHRAQPRAGGRIADDLFNSVESVAMTLFGVPLGANNMKCELPSSAEKPCSALLATFGATGGASPASRQAP